MLLAAFCVSMLTWIPVTWETVFNNGLTLSIILLSVTLITGMAGQLSLCQATFAGIGAFTAARVGRSTSGSTCSSVASSAASSRPSWPWSLALLSLRLRGLGLALMTLAAALLFDNTAFNDISVTGGVQGTSLQSKWLGTSAFFNFDGHAMFLLAMGVLIVAVVVVLQVRKGTVGRNLAAMRGSETATAGLGREPDLAAHRRLRAVRGDRRRSVACSTASSNSTCHPVDWNTDFSLVLVVLVVTTSVTTVEGAIQAGIGFFVDRAGSDTFLPRASVARA